FLSKLMLRGYVTTYLSLEAEPYDLVLDATTDPVAPTTEADTLDENRWWLIDMQEIDQALALTNVDVFHLLLGLLLVGAVGFVQFLFGSVVIGPVPTFGGFGLRNALRGNGGGQRGHGGADLVVALVIVVGAARALWTIYKGVRSASQRSLERLGSRILE